MSKRERRIHSLSSKLFASTFLIWMIAGMLVVSLGAVIYVNALLREKVTLAYNISQAAAMSFSRWTDAAGMTEAMTGEAELFGEKRLLETLAGAPDTDPEKLLPYVHGKVEAFAGGAPQFDDITMLCLRYLGGTVSPAETKKENG